MQLLAIDTEGRLVGVKQADRQAVYSCLECQGKVRARGGEFRQLHFYHLEPPHHCRQHQKGLPHLHVQSYLYASIGAEDCALEERMPAIQRIADVVWFSKKVVFEIQCSFITAEEVEKRNRDYGLLGWSVIWILHDERFNQTRYTAAEERLAHRPHYYTNIDSEGQGIIYDQFEYLCRGKRQHKLLPLPIQIHTLKDTQQVKVNNKSPAIAQQRLKAWPYYCECDLIDLSVRNSNLDYLHQVLEKENLIARSLRPGSPDLWMRLKKLYRTVFYHFLEKATR